MWSLFTNNSKNDNDERMTTILLVFLVMFTVIVIVKSVLKFRASLVRQTTLAAVRGA